MDWVELFKEATSFVIAVGVIVTAVLQYLQRAKVAEVKDKLETTTNDQARKLDDIAETGEKTHTLVNSNMGTQLQLGAELSRWKADRSPDDPDAQAAANEAERLYREHQGKQAQVDQRGG